MKSWLTMTVAVSCMLAVSGAAIGLDDGIAREGSGDRRASLNAMELAPFPADLWSSLKDWNGKAVTAADLEDKVVVIVTWASWARASHEALRTAQQIQDRYGDKGLIVVGVHHKDGFDGAAKVAQSRGVGFAYAHDADGAFRTGLKVDQDPDFYVIDRAGQLRFADIETSAADAAARVLVAETRDQAAGRKQQLSNKAAEAAARSRQTRPVSGNVQPGKLMDVPFSMPDTAAFQAASWPEKNTGQLYAGDFQGQALPASLGKEVWIGERPPMNGRVIVLDFWATWCGPCKAAMPGLDALQNSYRQDLVILGISGSARGNFKEDPAAIRSFLSSHRSAYYHANDLARNVYGALQVQGIPHVVVLSTDGTIRWQGMPGEPGFRKAVEQVIAVDPGVKARRAAEARMSE